MTERFVSDALDAIYASVTEPDALDRLVASLLGRFGGIAGDIVTEDVAAREIETLASRGFDPVFRDSYDESYLGHNPWLDALRRLGDRRFLAVEAASPALLDTAYYQEWALPQGLTQSVGALLESDGTRHTWFGLAGKDWPDARLVEICDALDPLLPHLRRAVGLARGSAARALRESDFSAALDCLRVAIVLLDHRRRIVFQNAAASALFSGNSGFRVDYHGRIGLTDAADDDRFRRAVSAAMQAHHVTTCPDSLRCILIGTDQITVQTMPIHGDARMDGGRVLVAFSDPVQMESAMLEGAAAGLGLTPTETALAAALLGGETLDAFAERQGMKVGTARWHLKNIGTKAETHRAEHLVARLARLALPLQRPPHMGGDD